MTENKQHSPIDWRKGFAKAFLSHFQMYPKATTNQNVNFIIKLLELKPGAKVLDCPAGIGRIAIPLARRRMKLTCVDLVPEYLEILKKSAERTKVSLEIVQSDMRKIEFNRRFDAALNLWTSIGYFNSDRDDQIIIGRLSRALKPGGKLLVQTINRDWICRHFTPSNWYEIPDGRVLQSRRFDLASSREDCTWRFQKAEGEQAIELTLRRYSLHELIAMFKAAGLSDIGSCSGMKMEPVTFDSRNIWIWGTRR